MVRWGRPVRGAQGSVASWALVAAQAVLFVGIPAAPASWGVRVPSLLVVGIAVGIAGLVGVVASALSLGKALTPLPEPNGAGMTVRGAYRWARHPMYTSVVTAFVGIAAVRGASIAWILVCALAILFVVKARREERLLAANYPGYEVYAARTGRFIPKWGQQRR